MSTNATVSIDDFLIRFGLTEFRPGQRDVISAVLDNRDCLCIMPTGGGKSLCYQLPSLARDGLTLVVSPLIALMKDQVDALKRKQIRADFINSSIESVEQHRRLETLEAGGYDLLYVAPERFRQQRFLEILRKIGVRLLAIDEAHCISEWGHDFRHDYARLGQYRKRIGDPPTIALTATATPDVREDVIKQLELKSPAVFIAGFARPNLEFGVERRDGKTDKLVCLNRFLSTRSGSGIIYVATRKACAEVAEAMQTQGRDVGIYHAGLAADQRRLIQESFMSDKLPIVVATNAFGMGIDKPDVRFVVHYNMPGNIESYYQEAGRAGRDGNLSQCLLLFSRRDRYIQEFFIESAYPSREVVRAVFEFLRNKPGDPIEITQQEIKDTLNLKISTEGVGTCERLLERAGAIRRLEPYRNLAVVRINSDLPTLLDLVPPQAKVRRKILQLIEAEVGEMRHAPVYVQPADWLASTGLTAQQLRKALRELTELKAFEYVPPFRGRSIHIANRDIAFDELDIDFETLEKRRALDFAKLEAMVQYAETSSCRQVEMMTYFGDTAANSCRRCDNCVQRNGPPPDVQPVATTRTVAPVEDQPALARAVRMTLSGVARCKERFGTRTVAAMLGGSRSSKITKWKLDELSTFGLLKQLQQAEILELLEALASAGLVVKNEIDRFRPVVALTHDGVRVMRGEEPVPRCLSLPKLLLAKIASYFDPAMDAANTSAKRPTNQSTPSIEVDAPARESAEFTNSSATEVKEDIIGDIELSRERFDVVGRDDRRFNVHFVKPPRSESDSAVPSHDDATGSADAQPPYYWTWRLFHDGYPLHDVLAIREAGATKVIYQLLRAAECGYNVDLGWVLTLDQQGQLDQLLREHGPDWNPDAAGNLPAGILMSHWILFAKCRSLVNPPDNGVCHVETAREFL